MPDDNYCQQCKAEAEVHGDTVRCDLCPRPKEIANNPTDSNDRLEERELEKDSWS